MDLEAELLNVVTALDDAGVPYALCGGLAVAVHGFARATKDIDLMVLASDVQSAMTALAALGFDLDAGDLPFDSGTPNERRIRRITKASGADYLSIDLVHVTPALEQCWNGATDYEWNGRRITVVSRDGLAHMKRLSGRPQDLVDLRKLGLEPDDERT